MKQLKSRLLPTTPGHPSRSLFAKSLLVSKTILYKVTVIEANHITSHQIKANQISQIEAHNCIAYTDFVLGPECDPAARNVALWFNIDEKHVAEYSAQNAKRYRYRPPPKSEEGTGSHFDILECFFMVRPHDVDAYHLTTRILKHRLGVLRAEHVSTSMRGRHEKLKCLEIEKLELKKLIEFQINHWKRWAWPIKGGRDLVDDNTPIPPVDGYYFEDPDKMQRDMESKTKTSISVTGKIWKSFVSCNFTEDLDSPTSALVSIVFGAQLGLA